MLKNQVVLFKVGFCAGSRVGRWFSTVRNRLMLKNQVVF
jgi:hypothetical protein